MSDIFVCRNCNIPYPKQCPACPRCKVTQGNIPLFKDAAPDGEKSSVMNELYKTQIYIGMRCSTCYQEIVGTAYLVPLKQGENHKHRLCDSCWNKEN